MDILNWSKEPKNRLFLYDALHAEIMDGRYWYCCNYLNSSIMRSQLIDLGVDELYTIIGYRKDNEGQNFEQCIYLEDILPELLKYKHLNLKPGDEGSAWFNSKAQRIDALQQACNDLRVGHNIPITV